MNDAETKTFRFFYGGRTLDFLPVMLEPLGNLQTVQFLGLTVHCSKTCYLKIPLSVKY